MRLSGREHKQALAEPRRLKANTIALLGVPIDVGGSQRGTLMGPMALRIAGLVQLLEELGYIVDDCGDLSITDLPPLNDNPPPGIKHYRDIQNWIRALSARAYLLAHSGTIPLFLGGNHSLSIGSINGLARHWHEQNRELFVLWLDAHADYNTPTTTLTGNMHGMATAFLCGEDGMDDFLGSESRISIRPDQLRLFGIRSIDRAEKELIRARSIDVVDMRQIDELGVSVSIRRIIDGIRARNGVLHVSFDVDFLDPELAPGVGTTVPGGVTYREAHLVMELLHDSGLVRSVDIVELNPFLDERSRTARVVVELIGSLFGQHITDRPTPTNAIRSPSRGG